MIANSAASGRRATARTIIIATAVAILSGVWFLWGPGPASGQQASIRIVAPASVSAGGDPFAVRIEVEGIPAPAPDCTVDDDYGLCGLGAYEWHIAYDPAVIELTDPPLDAAQDAGFLGSTGRPTLCLPASLPPAVDDGTIRFGCVSLGSQNPGPSGNGLLSTVTFRPVASGNVNISFVCAGLADFWETSIPLTGAPECKTQATPTATPLGATPEPTDTPVPGQPTATPTPPVPGATATPLPTPLPGEREQIQLVSGCNLRSFQPQYAPGTELIAVAVDISGGNPRIWFQVGGTPFFDLFDFRSVERSTKTVLGEADEAGFICLDSDAVWSRPILQ